MQYSFFRSLFLIVYYISLILLLLSSNRVDASSVASAAASGTDDLDIAMGTLMAYGGKYLREIAISAWEYGTQQPLNSIGKVFLSKSFLLKKYLIHSAFFRGYDNKRFGWF